MNIVEYIGHSGVRTTNHSQAWFRIKQPKPGDLIRIPKELQMYPFTRGEWARIATIGPDSVWCKEGEAHICCEKGSCFLCENGCVLISGGPFCTIKLADLEPAYELGESLMWNWGDNSPGASQGVYYCIMRPVFVLKRHPAEN